MTDFSFVIVADVSTFAEDALVVHLSGNEAIDGVKTFLQKIHAAMQADATPNGTAYLPAPGDLVTGLNPGDNIPKLRIGADGAMELGQGINNYKPSHKPGGFVGHGQDTTWYVEQNRNLSTLLTLSYPAFWVWPEVSGVPRPDLGYRVSGAFPQPYDTGHSGATGAWIANADFFGMDTTNWPASGTGHLRFLDTEGTFTYTSKGANVLHGTNSSLNFSQYVQDTSTRNIFIVYDQIGSPIAFMDNAFIFNVGQGIVFGANNSPNWQPDDPSHPELGGRYGHIGSSLQMNFLDEVQRDKVAMIWNNGWDAFYGDSIGYQGAGVIGTLPERIDAFKEVYERYVDVASEGLIHNSGAPVRYSRTARETAGTAAHGHLLRSVRTLNPDGSVASPAVSFASDPTTGFARVSGVITASLGGVEVGLLSGLGWSAPVDVRPTGHGSTALTNAFTTVAVPAGGKSAALPTASTHPGATCTVVLASVAGGGTLQVTGGQGGTVTMTIAGQSRTWQSDGTNWWLVAGVG